MIYSVRDLVTRYSVTEQTVLKWISSGELKAINVGRKMGKKKPRWRVSEKALEEFELLRSTFTAPPTTRRRKRKQPADVIQFYK